MTWNVYQHWDPLKVCVVGRSYPPEFYGWITEPHVRDLFERIAIETEEDFQCIIQTLHKFGVEVLRPELPEQISRQHFEKPPMTPRDYTVMIGETFYSNWNCGTPPFAEFYNSVKDASWPECFTIDEFANLPAAIQQECKQQHKMDYHLSFRKHSSQTCYDNIFQKIQAQGNIIKHGFDPRVIGSMVSRIGKDLYFGTETYKQVNRDFQKKIKGEFANTRNHIVNTGGHSDGTYCPVCPGLIISLHDVPTYTDTFPGWEVVYLPNQSWTLVKDFVDLKKKNLGRWWIPGFEHDNAVIDVVETWLKHWTGYVEETVFDVNMLIIDPKNVMVFNYNKQVFDAFDRYGITPHVVNFRHRYFWDGGIHCVTSDLHREGSMQDWFPDRS